MKKSRVFPEVAIVGMGLIGGSLGLALRRCGIRVRGIDRSAALLGKVLSRNAASRLFTSLRDGVRGAGLVVLCVPFRGLARCVARVDAAIGPNAVVTDVTSVKSAVLRLVGSRLDRPGRFVGGHPMAGSEKSGFGAANAGLFAGRPCVVTPRRETQRRATELVLRMWKACGAVPIVMSPAEHDRAVARVSHLPHALAGILVRYALSRRAAARIASGSFLDVTRVAASPAKLWRDIFSANRSEAGRAILEYARVLRRFGESVRRGRLGVVEKTLRIAARQRRGMKVRGS